MILTLASSKGGPGKTLISALLLGTLANAGVRPAAVDTDPTGALSRWAKHHYEGPPFRIHHQVEETPLTDLLAELEREHPLVIVDTAGFGNRSAAMAITASDAVLVPLVPGEADVSEAVRTLAFVASIARASRRTIPARVVLNRVRSTTLSRHIASEVDRLGLPRAQCTLSELVAYAEQTYSGRLPVGERAEAEVAMLIDELTMLGFLPTPPLRESAAA